MSRRHSVQYTVRDIPEHADLRLRAVAAAEKISLNKAAVQALSRGLGLDAAGVRHRSLRGLLRKRKAPDRKAWARTLEAMDKIEEADWT